MLVKKKFSTNQFTVKDSFSFAEWAKMYNHNNKFMRSFDVSSLFTNVPLAETIAGFHMTSLKFKLQNY